MTNFKNLALVFEFLQRAKNENLNLELIEKVYILVILVNNNYNRS